jgi:hypothetical protein
VQRRGCHTGLLILHLQPLSHNIQAAGHCCGSKQGAHGWQRRHDQLQAVLPGGAHSPLPHLHNRRNRFPVCLPGGRICHHLQRGPRLGQHLCCRLAAQLALLVANWRQVA